MMQDKKEKVREAINNVIDIRPLKYCIYCGEKDLTNAVYIHNPFGVAKKVNRLLGFATRMDCEGDYVGTTAIIGNCIETYLKYGGCRNKNKNEIVNGLTDVILKLFWE